MIACECIDCRRTKGMPGAPCYAPDPQVATSADDSNFPPDPSPLALAAVLAVAALVIGAVVAAGMWFGVAR